MADLGGGLVMREYRKGNWTLNETMVLIEAKKMDDERRMRRSIGLLPASDQAPDNRSSKPGELRWKWIEDYCWRKGCMRSQNQCNDKWDNLMRDYKKVREYERRRVESSFDPEESSSSTTTPSYWKMEKSERKERSLPSNMLPQTYQALHEVVESKNVNIPSSTVTVAASTVSAVAVGSGNGSGGGQIQSLVHQSLGYVPMRAQPKQQIPPPVMLSLPPPPPPPSPPLLRPLMMPQPPPLPLSFHAQPIQPTKGSSSDSDTSDYSETTPAKRRRKTPGEATTTTTTTTTATAGPSGEGGGAEEEETTMGAALWRSASVIAEALKENEERQEKRHKELLNLQERRLKIEESNAKMNKQGMDGLVEAINKLATSIFTLASSSSRQQEHGAPP